MEHLTGVGMRCQQWVQPQDLGVAVGRTHLLLARHLADGRVHVDDETGRQGRISSGGPGDEIDVVSRFIVEAREQLRDRSPLQVLPTAVDDVDGVAKPLEVS